MGQKEREPRNDLPTLGRDLGAVFIRTLPPVLLLSSQSNPNIAEGLMRDYVVGITSGVANYVSRRFQRSRSDTHQEYDRNSTLDEVESFFVGANVIAIQEILHQDTDITVKILEGLGLVALNAIALYSTRGYEEPHD